MACMTNDHERPVMLISLYANNALSVGFQVGYFLKRSPSVLSIFLGMFENVVL